MTKSGYLEHFLRIDLRRGGRGEATSKEGHQKSPFLKELTLAG